MNTLSWLALKEWNDTQIPGTEMPQAISDFKKLLPEASRSNYRRDPTVLDPSDTNAFVQLTVEGLIPRPAVLLEPAKIDPDPFNILLFRRAMSVNHRFTFATPPENSTKNPSWAKCHPDYAIS
jgi:hypothetical protein